MSSPYRPQPGTLSGTRGVSDVVAGGLGGVDGIGRVLTDAADRIGAAAESGNGEENDTNAEHGLYGHERALPLKYRHRGFLMIHAERAFGSIPQIKNARRTMPSGRWVGL